MNQQEKFSWKEMKYAELKWWANTYIGQRGSSLMFSSNNLARFRSIDFSNSNPPLGLFLLPFLKDCIDKCSLLLLGFNEFILVEALLKDFLWLMSLITMLIKRTYKLVPKFVDSISLSISFQWLLSLLDCIPFCLFQ